MDSTTITIESASTIAHVSGLENGSTLDPPKAGALEQQASMSGLRRYALLVVLCLASFLDALGTSVMVPAVPTIRQQLGMSNAEAVWLVSAFNLTSASFLLLSGRISDIYDPKDVFVTGMAGMGVFCLGSGFLHSKITLIVFRALIGCTAALTIPSALKLLVVTFPEPQQQSRAIAVFGSFTAVGLVPGPIIGGAFVEWLSWRWCFWLLAAVALPVAGLTFLLVSRREKKSISARDRLRKLDLIGVSTLTVAIILLIFGVTSGSTNVGWKSPAVIVPIISSVILFGLFILWESRVAPENAVVPPHTWFYPNFGVLLSVALLPFFWWTATYYTFMKLWQDVYHWSALASAIRELPLGVTLFAIAYTDGLARKIDVKWLILFGQICMVCGTLLCTFADAQDKYWRFVFPAFVIGSAGATLAYTHTNIAIFRTTPSSQAGTVGAIFNAALNLGSALGYAIVGSAEASVEAHSSEGIRTFAGRRLAFYILMGAAAIEAVVFFVFFRRDQKPANSESADMEVSSMAEKATVEESTV